MTEIASISRPDGMQQSRLQARPNSETSGPDADLAKRFEQMLWAEMLSHAGLEEAFTQNGGEAASAFSRFIVESIAADLAQSQPLGFADALDLEAPSAPSRAGDETE